MRHVPMPQDAGLGLGLPFWCERKRPMHGRCAKGREVPRGRHMEDGEVGGQLGGLQWGSSKEGGLRPPTAEVGGAAPDSDPKTVLSEKCLLHPQ